MAQPTPAPSASASGASAPSAPRAATPGDTRGTIACGTARCIAGKEVCVYSSGISEGWACAPDKSFGSGLACDDGLDCPKGETCCAQFFEDFSSSSCVPRGRVVADCRSELCVIGGAKCPVGTTCVETSPGQGTCEPPKGPATCGGEKRCSTTAPICALTNAGPQCVAVGSPLYAATPGEQRYECTKQSDCNGGDSCSGWFGEAAPSVAAYCAKWGPHLANRVCDPRTKGRVRCLGQGQPKELPWFGTESSDAP